MQPNVSCTNHSCCHPMSPTIGPMTCHQVGPMTCVAAGTAHRWLHQLPAILKGAIHRLLKGATHRYTCTKQNTPHTTHTFLSIAHGVWCVLLHACIPVGCTFQQPMGCAFQTFSQLMQPTVGLSATRTYAARTLICHQSSANCVPTANVTP